MVGTAHAKRIVLYCARQVCDSSDILGTNVFDDFASSLSGTSNYR